MVSISRNSSSYLFSISMLALLLFPMLVQAQTNNAVDFTSDSHINKLDRNQLSPTFTVIGTYWTGQSLSTGFSVQNPISIQPASYNNLVLNPVYPGFSPDSNGAFNPIQYTTGGTNVSPGYGLANYLSANFGLLSWTSAYGQDGLNYQALKKGTTPYINGINSIATYVARAATYGEVYEVPAVLLVHGEADGASSTYDNDLIQWQSDYETDIKATTGQSGSVPFIYSQVGSLYSTTISPGDLEMYQLARDQPDKFALVGSKYSYVSGDGTHLRGFQYLKLGEKYGQVLNWTKLQGHLWRGITSKSITISGNVITIIFHCPVPPLRRDMLVTDPGNWGFEYTDNSGAPPTISKVALSGKRAVIITLSAPPTATAGNRIVRYAYTNQRVFIPISSVARVAGQAQILVNTVSNHDYSSPGVWCITGNTVYDGCYNSPGLASTIYPAANQVLLTYLGSSTATAFGGNAYSDVRSPRSGIRGQLSDSDISPSVYFADVNCVLTRGSTTVTLAPSADFEGVNILDNVTALLGYITDNSNGSPTRVANMSYNRQAITLSRAASASGTVTLRVRFDLRNYAPHFSETF